MLSQEGCPTPTPARRKRRGATSLEYLFVISLIFVVCIAAIQQVGQMTKKLFVNNAEKIEGKDGSVPK